MPEGRISLPQLNNRLGQDQVAGFDAFATASFAHIHDMTRHCSSPYRARGTNLTLQAPGTASPEPRLK